MWQWFLTVLQLIIQNSGLGTWCEVYFMWMPQNLTNEKSTLVQVMAWCHQATSHYLSQCWPRVLLNRGWADLTYCITNSEWVKPCGNYCWGGSLEDVVEHFKFFNFYTWFDNSYRKSILLNCCQGFIADATTLVQVTVCHHQTASLNQCWSRSFFGGVITPQIQWWFSSLTQNLMLV